MQIQQSDWDQIGGLCTKTGPEYMTSVSHDLGAGAHSRNIRVSGEVEPQKQVEYF